MAGHRRPLRVDTHRQPHRAPADHPHRRARLVRATHGKFPLNFTYPLVAWFDGPNDGLVARDSFPWGERFIWLEPTGRRGISHADMIDLNRENIEGFDVREFYVQLVSELKTRGL